ncbi:RTA1 like protein-domain-containing protein [Phyllosticta citrichinensis]|uniref:RTA1 like protein-domain-containing protein n=1 Tax=Phyllosticta citrichinensis TaxID=1130410 RepID=A0ABR1XQP0_9PEZI
MASDTVEYTLYNYSPSLAAAVIFIACFGISSVAHVIQLTMKKTWYFIPFVIGGLFETVGYIGRAMNSQDKAPNWSIDAYIIQSLLLLIGPTFFAASIYMILGRIIRLTNGEAHSVVRATWVTKIFVAGDVLSFLMQSAGGGMLAKANSADDQELGEHIIVGGLIVQILFFGFFVIASGLFHYRIRAYPTNRSQTISVPWERYLVILYVASLLILWRSIYRLAEYIQGSDGTLQMHEAYLYVFDALLMFITCIIFNIWHPSTIISHKNMAVPQEKMEFSS